MKTIKFFCTNCEAERRVVVKLVDDYYIVGYCEVCKIKITINRAKAKNF